jgi:hypothetical protein
LLIFFPGLVSHSIKNHPSLEDPKCEYYPNHSAFSHKDISRALAIMSKVSAAVKASLVGTQEEELAMSQQIKANFIQYARKDESSGELYMTEDEFVNAIAPKNQDYVSQRPISTLRTALRRVEFVLIDTD